MTRARPQLQVPRQDSKGRALPTPLSSRRPQTVENTRAPRPPELSVTVTSSPPAPPRCGRKGSPCTEAKAQPRGPYARPGLPSGVAGRRVCTWGTVCVCVSTCVDVAQYPAQRESQNWRQPCNYLDVQPSPRLGRHVPRAPVRAGNQGQRRTSRTHGSSCTTTPSPPERRAPRACPSIRHGPARLAAPHAEHLCPRQPPPHTGPFPRASRLAPTKCASVWVPTPGAPASGSCRRSLVNTG